MPFSLALTTGTVAQNEGNPGGTAASWTYTITRSGADIDTAIHTYSFAIRDPSGGSLVNDFATFTTAPGGTVAATGGTGVFTIAANAPTATITFTADPDITVEPSEAPIIWFYPTATTAGQQILSTNDTAINPTLTNDDTGAPVFSTPAAISVAENTTTVGTVTAASGGTAVTYTITGGADQALFAINNTTGALTFGGAKDFETPDDAGNDRVYNVQVTATAGGATTAQDLVVTLTNANEDPVITSNGGGAATTTGAISENTTAVLATNTATDVDAGDVLTWSISGGADAAKFVIDAQTGALSFASPPNWEAHADAGANDTFDVTIRVTDAGGKFDEQTVAVPLIGADDPAVITSYNGADLLVLSASENTATTTTLATVVAADDDAGSTITYSLTGPDAAQFAISAGGLLTFATSPDYELPADTGADNSYDVTVVATPTSGATDAQRFIVFVGNVAEIGDPNNGGGGGFTPPTPPTPPKPNLGGTGNNDSLIGTAGPDIRAGGEGNDTIDGADGADSIDGDNGNDQLNGGSGDDFIRGLNDSDTVYGGDGADTVNGNLGDDSVQGDSGNDVVYGGQGQDWVFGGDGDDSYVNGNIGNDTVHGDAGNDSVYGGQNDDIIYGDDGNDLLSGDLGNDQLVGGFGADRFTIAPNGGGDWVIDFNAAEGDRIQLAPGTTYSVSSYQGNVLLIVGGTASLGLIGVSSFDPSWVVYG